VRVVVVLGPQRRLLLALQPERLLLLLSGRLLIIRLQSHGWQYNRVAYDRLWQ
jgi:hypothetical protein